MAINGIPLIEFRKVDIKNKLVEVKMVAETTIAEAKNRRIAMTVDEEWIIKDVIAKIQEAIDLLSQK